MFTAFKKLKPSEIPACYTFKKFSADLGILHGINDVDYRFCEQMDYFKTKYDCNQLSDFSFAAIQPELVSIAPSLDFEQHIRLINSLRLSPSSLACLSKISISA